jgi:single-strand DNA-binding protein
VVQGRLKVRSWEKDDRSGITVEVDALTVGHDLSRGTAMFRPVRRSAAAESTEATESTEAAEATETAGEQAA